VIRIGTFGSRPEVPPARPRLHFALSAPVFSEKNQQQATHEHRNPLMLAFKIHKQYDLCFLCSIPHFMLKVIVKD
jgi:hypothetical protein